MQAPAVFNQKKAYLDGEAFDVGVDLAFRILNGAALAMLNNAQLFSQSLIIV